MLILENIYFLNFIEYNRLIEKNNKKKETYLTLPDQSLCLIE